MEQQLRKAFEYMMLGKKVRLTKEGREFWCKPTETFPIFKEVGQWFEIVAVRGDSVDIVGVHHDCFDMMPIEYIRL